MPSTPRRPRLLRRASATVALGLLVSTAVALDVTAASAKKDPKPSVNVTVGDSRVLTVGGQPQQLPDDVRTGVIAAVTGYLRAIAASAQTGRTDDAALGLVLTPAVAARLPGDDRANLVDEGLPAATGKVKVATAPVVVTGLADGAGKVVVATTNLVATTTIPTAKGKVKVERRGDLVLAPDATGWKISGYELHTYRVGKGLATAPAAGSTATTLPTGATTPTTGKASK